jgi:sugar lactone lactonase YvrE
VAVDRSGNVYVAMTETLANYGMILKVSPSAFETIPTTGVPRNPRLAADAAGNLYMTDRENNAIRKLSFPAREVTTVVASGLNAPFDVSVDDAGNLFIADADGIKRWDVTMQRATTVIGENLRQPVAVAVDSDGNVYVTDTGGFDSEAGSALKVWSRATQQLTTIVPLVAPSGVAIDAKDGIYASDELGVYRVDLATRQLTTLFSGFPNRPAGIAVDAFQHIYVAFPHYHTVRRLDDLTETLIPNLDWPEFVATDRSGNLYVTDTLPSAVRRWEASTHSVTTIASAADLSSPAGVAVDGDGNVFVADTDSGAIKKWSPSTQQWTTVALGLDGPVGIAVGHDGTLYFTESGASALKAIVPSGRRRAVTH